MSFAEAMGRIRIPRVHVDGTLASLLTAAVLALLSTFVIPEDAPLTQLQVRGPLQNVRPEDVRAAVHDQLDASFFEVDVARVRDTVGQLPWVARASVERVWPGAISVRVWERTAFARWNEDSLLDTASQAFTPRAADIPTGLPQLGGVAGHEGEVTAAWKRMSEALAGTALALSGLSMDARGEWTARAANGVELRLGTDAPDRHIALLTGVVQRELGGRWGDVQYIDLRYTNGFAVGWAKPQPVVPEKGASAKGGRKSIP
ncbi:MAG TPA: FtsQ-type POTRA domain-containing protein [Nevskiaceae bacterium]|nr:FtsQ-type POTRA domain-containing protein [Nevskiaceae bacterium]